ncbi:MAG: hypothetical protein CMM78_04795 [Rhodospirillaceae bacterium]|nr:hypothetical protein [Rhodospirillaceae bacterium]
MFPILDPALFLQGVGQIDSPNASISWDGSRGHFKTGLILPLLRMLQTLRERTRADDRQQQEGQKTECVSHDQQYRENSADTTGKERPCRTII